MTSHLDLIQLQTEYDLNSIVYIHASEQQILIKMRTTKSLKNLRIFCPLLGTVHYWELLLNKNGWEAGFCPLLGAFPLLGSALLGEYSVHPKMAAPNML